MVMGNNIGRLKEDVSSTYSADIEEMSILISNILDKNEIEYVLHKIEDNMTHYIDSVNTCPLCKRFYYKNCRECPYKDYEDQTFPYKKGCHRFYLDKTGPFGDEKSNILRWLIYNSALLKKECIE